MLDPQEGHRLVFPNAILSWRQLMKEMFVVVVFRLWIQGDEGEFYLDMTTGCTYGGA